MKDKHNAALRGIVVAGDSREQAENNYRAVATGVSVQPYRDSESTFVIISNADSDLTLLNPLTGDMDMAEASTTVTDKLEFLASDSEEPVQAFYTICSDGCGSHLIADDNSVMQRCPVCASDLKDLSEEQILELTQEATASENNEDDDVKTTASSESKDEDGDDVEATASDDNTDDVEATASEEDPDVEDVETTASNSNEDEKDLETTAASEEDSDVEDVEATASSEEDSDVEEDAIIAVASSMEEAAEIFKNIVVGETESSFKDCGTGNVATASSCDANFKFSPYTGEPSSNLEGDFTAKASDNNSEELEANWYVCASDECGMHIVSSSESPVFCPECSSGLIEPEQEVEAVASADDDDDDVIEDEVDAEATATAAIESEDEDHPEIESTSKAKSKCSEEEDEDEDEDDLDEDDLDEDEDDLDDENTLSVSSVTVEASDENSKEPDEKPEITNVDVNLMSIASASGELNASELEVIKLGPVSDESKWMAFYGGNPIATATASSSKAEDTVFESQLFGQLVLASAKENGVETSLKENGFEPITASAFVEDFVLHEINDQVDTRIESVSGEYKQASEDHSERFLAALATAAAGINKNFFEDVDNPVKGALVSALASMNVGNPEKMVATAFNTHNDTYLKNLMAKTQEIMDYDLNVQNQLTKAIAGTSKEIEATASAESDSLSIGKPVEFETKKQSQEIEATASNNKPSMNDILSTLGKH